jgi:hypothetical protein
VDTGNLTNTPSKLDVITTVYSRLNYDAIGLGVNDVRLKDTYYEQVEAKKLPILDAAPSAREFTKPYLIKNVGGVKVGVVSFGALSGKDDSYQLKKSLYSAYRFVRDASDILVVLDSSGTVTSEWLETMGKRFGEPDIVIPSLNRASITKPEIIGKTHICPISLQGKYLGVVDVKLSDGRDPEFDIRQLPLDDKDYKEDEEIRKLVNRERESAVASSANLIAKNSSKVVTTLNLSPAERKPYYPPELCKTCHVEEYKQWVGSMHATALKTIVDANRTVPECLTCHSEMYRRLGQWVAKEDDIAGVECATCHLDSLPHGLERINVKQKTKVDPAMCLSCHTKDRSPDYNEKTYMPKITHVTSDEEDSE